MIWKLRLFMSGVFILIQFFTSIPVRKNFSLTKQELTHTLYAFPVLGLLQGCLYAGVLYLLVSFLPVSDLVLALLLWLFLIVLSGGIHLDGWIDASDAYFSYQEPKKRLEVMQDPRVGAFGVLSVVVFLFVRFIAIYELIRMGEETLYGAILLIPFFGKMLMGILLEELPPAKPDGMASFFQQGKSSSYRMVYLVFLLALGGIFYTFGMPFFLIFISFTIMMLLLGWRIAEGIRKHFGGVSGDTVGAGSEGMELILWLTLLLLHSFATR